MPYPEEAEGFQVDSPDTYTDFKKRFVCRTSVLQETPRVTNAFEVQIEAVWRLWYVDRGMITIGSS